MILLYGLSLTLLQLGRDSVLDDRQLVHICVERVKDLLLFGEYLWALNIIALQRIPELLIQSNLVHLGVGG